MAVITIDGIVCEFEGKPSILQVALDNNIELPHYCYHPGLSVVASCRICLAEVAQPNPRNEGKLELIPKLLPTCQTTAVDGAEVYTKSDKSIANQKAVMEYLLINHPLDCPVCDQAGECYLQDYSYDYGRGHSRFEETKIKQPKKDLGPNIYLYADRCIMCTRCVRFTREVTGTGELCVSGRGNREQIDVFPGKALDNELSANVADICPVGALLDKDFLFEQRVWNLTGVPSVDGYTSSGDNIWVDHNDNRVWRLRPRHNPHVNKWWISDEIRYAWKHVHSDSRLGNPMVRSESGPQRESWADALDAAVNGLRDVVQQGKRIALMVSPMLSCEDAYLLAMAVRAIDAQAILVEGPVPVVGQDKTFPGGYTIRAEKAPNARGVRHVLQGFGEVKTYTEAVNSVLAGDSAVGAVVLTGNYPNDWAGDQLIESLANRFTVLIDTLGGALTGRANVILPGATWVEKTGTFENVDGRLQAFCQAINPPELARAEGQIGLDLLTAAGEADATRYDAATVREAIGGVFVTEVHIPASEDTRKPDIEYAEL